MQWGSVNLLRRISGMLYTTDVFFNFEPRCHEFVSASKATKPKIGTGTKHEPLLLPAGMCFFHSQNITNFDIHINLRMDLFFLDRIPILFCGLLKLVGAILVVNSANKIIR